MRHGGDIVQEPGLDIVMDQEPGLEQLLHLAGRGLQLAVEDQIPVDAAFRVQPAFPLGPAVSGVVQLLVLVEHEADAGRMPAVGVLEGRRGVQLVLGAFDQHGAVAQGQGHAADLHVGEILFVIAAHGLDCGLYGGFGDLEGRWKRRRREVFRFLVWGLLRRFCVHVARGVVLLQGCDGR